MATSTSFAILHEVHHDHGQTAWRLCFQCGVLRFGDDGHETGYRFIWRRQANAAGKQTLQSVLPQFTVGDEKGEAHAGA